MDCDASFSVEVHADVCGEVKFDTSLGQMVSVKVTHDPGPFSLSVCQWTKETCDDVPVISLLIPYENAVAIAEMILAVDRTWTKAARANKTT